jgi:UDP-N-acetylglucosamine acyltransferase
MHKALYRDDLTLDTARIRIAALVDEAPEAAPDVDMMVSFLEQTSPQRGIVR